MVEVRVRMGFLSCSHSLILEEHIASAFVHINKKVNGEHQAHI